MNLLEVFSSSFFYFAMCDAALYDGGLFVFQGRH